MCQIWYANVKADGQTDERTSIAGGGGAGGKEFLKVYIIFKILYKLWNIST